MKFRNLTRVLVVSLLCFALPIAAVADDDSRAAMDACWKLVGNTTGADPLTRAMNDEYAAGTELPEGFPAWLLLDDEWHDDEWDDDDDWREGRSKWVVEDWVDAGSLREAYGREAVVDEDEVERILRQHGFRFDD